MTMTLVETIEVGAGGASSLEFLSIPQNGVDLLCVISGRSDSSATARNLSVRFNSDTTSGNYTQIRLSGDGSSASSATFTGTQLFFDNCLNAATSTSGTFNSAQLYVSNYTGSNSKSVSMDGVMENNATTAYSTIQAGIYTPSTAISSIQLEDPSGANFVQYSTASLFIIS